MSYVLHFASLSSSSFDGKTSRGRVLFAIINDYKHDGFVAACYNFSGVVLLLLRDCSRHFPHELSPSIWHLSGDLEVH